MNLKFKDNMFFENMKDIFIEKNGKILKIFFGGNGDLYFKLFEEYSINELESKISNFCISQDDIIYSNFEKLTNDILNCNVFDLTDIEFKFCNYDNIKMFNKRLKNTNIYTSLVHNEIIEWVSDSICDEKANKLRIEKNEKEIFLTFINNPKDSIFDFGIRINNSRSKYAPFNICFMNLFNQLQEYSKSEIESSYIKKLK